MFTHSLCVCKKQCRGSAPCTVGEDSTCASDFGISQSGVCLPMKFCEFLKMPKKSLPSELEGKFNGCCFCTMSLLQKCLK